MTKLHRVTQTTAPSATSSFPKHHHRRSFHHLPGQPVPMSNRPFWEEIPPKIQHTPPPAQLRAISSYPVSRCLVKSLTPPRLHPPARELRERADPP